MDANYLKAKQIKLGDVGKDEKWLQERVQEDPSILGLGDLSVIERERQQISGGRIDFLMYNPEDGIRYEIEIMIGKLDESHIIRTIEYWDVERRRYPSLEHRAVIVAEEITNRFFNVISLLNRAIPIIAVQLNAFLVDNNLVLNFVKVLDITEPTDEEEQGTMEVVDRKYWEGRSNEKSLKLMDDIVILLQNISPDVRVTYNKNHIALGTTGNNFAWFHPRKGSHIHFNLKTGSEVREKRVSQFEEVGIECRSRSNGQEISIVLTSKELLDNNELFKEIFTVCEKYSRE